MGAYYGQNATQTAVWPLASSIAQQLQQLGCQGLRIPELQIEPASNVVWCHGSAPWMHFSYGLKGWKLVNSESPKLETKVDWHRLARWKYSNNVTLQTTSVCGCFLESFLVWFVQDTLFRPLAWLCPVSCGCLDQPQPYCPSNCRNGTVG